MNIRIIKRLNQGLNDLRCNSDLQSDNNFFFFNEKQKEAITYDFVLLQMIS